MAMLITEICYSSTARVLNGSAGGFAAAGRPKQPLENPVGAPVAAASAATPRTETTKTLGNCKVLLTIKLPAFDNKLSLENFLVKLKTAQIITIDRSSKNLSFEGCFGGASGADTVAN